MGTDRITPSSSLLETLRALARDRTQDVQRGTPAGKSIPKDGQIPVIAKHDVQALRSRLHELAAETDLSDTQSMLQARSQVLREILLWEFGGDFRMDSQFLPVVDAIGKTLDADPNLQQRFMDLMTDLRKA
ncbi:hypothetical protein [Dyella caseinilytica]|uniref:Uncharacterized protein n=1 Tax=Dyella caseinilytica TaxID=1849581 RepID=A0ABX7GQH8_9GAMM|nr:hypothetical protein [Dyella caseinilytica]QRN52077.1 hypothetical protein ISN74_11220 [Dyella caseinilytica]GGA15620.1 hypothetical protein GCM10011408_41990 [Dyella caseinilytica]